MVYGLPLHYGRPMSRRAAALAALIAMTILATVGGARAETSPSAQDRHDARARADTILSSAEAEDEAFAFARALARYDEGRALDPGSPRAPRAEARAAELRAHSEGDFGPYAKLERVRRDPALSSDPRAVEQLVHEAETFPPGPVRVEVWVLAAEAFAHRFQRPGDADPLLRLVLADSHADPVVAQKAARDLVTLQLARGDLARAREAARLAGSRADPKLLRDVERAIRRRSLHHAAIAVLAVMVLLAVRGLIAAVRRGAGQRIRGALGRMWRLAVAYATYVAVGGALLASGYETGTSKPFLYFGVVLVPILLIARAWGAAEGTSNSARSGRAIVCGAAALGAAFLVLEAVDIAYLEGMGL
jgi:hypothetical protein